MPEHTFPSEDNVADFQAKMREKTQNAVVHQISSDFQSFPAANIVDGSTLVLMTIKWLATQGFLTFSHELSDGTDTFVSEHKQPQTIEEMRDQFWKDMQSGNYS